MGNKTAQLGVWLVMLWLVSSCGGTQHAAPGEIKQPESERRRQIDFLLADLVSDFIPGVSVTTQNS
ncbi:hypothetical protein L1285_14595 [Pseudoalteromonas sp. DL2-H2.2]|uniref:Uncharacterized protein n=1 Tax=Pseudoalteromonas rubra TaxID=43658 RepID=A0A0F4QPQ9_9GAMM|nr:MULTISPECIES: hypothetical protein [Pseudoalteromonas]KJZ09651.1 hypothetical protein TW77_09145 [Pseudoalteromonas rubra]MCF2909551.1 hypothetical protein [Pseudoalteromonas sp. DL2-H2.2]